MKNRRKTALLAAVPVLLLLALIPWCCHRSTHGGKTPEVSSGTLVEFPDFPSKNVGPRKVSVWLPDGYVSGDSCAVIYMHDGQMLFDAETTWNHQEWKVDESLGRLVAAGKVRPCIVVATDNTSKRLTEYFPEKTARYVSGGEKASFQGDAYLKFIVEELKPFIDSHYHPLAGRENTFVAGSSMGGLISLYALCEYPEVFGGAACLSSHVSMAMLKLPGDNDQWAEAFTSYVHDHLPAANSARVYMDHGTEGLDANYDPWQRKIDTQFRESGWDDSHYQSLVFGGHDHGETSWAARLDEPLTFLLGTPAAAQL